MKQLISAFQLLALLAISLTPNSAIANPPLTPAQLASKNPPPAPDNGTPQTGTGAGTRPTEESNCPMKPHPLIVFMPERAKILASSTALWLYIPYTPEEIDKLRVLILDKQSGEYLLSPTTIPLADTPGFISIPISAIETGKEYAWTVSIFCDADDREDRISISGVLEAGTSPDLTWYEEINRLGEQRRSNPADAASLAEWTRLLESLELGELAGEPILDNS